MADHVVSLDRLQELLEAEPAAGAMRLLAESFLAQGLYPQAVATSRRALSLYPGNPEFRLLLGQSLHSLGETAAAEEHLQLVAREIGRLGEAFDTLGQLYAAQGRSFEAEQAAELYRLLKEGLARLLEGEEELAPIIAPVVAPLAAAPSEGDRGSLLLSRTIEELEKWQRALGTN
jgi:predicted Zn-dependent protease